MKKKETRIVDISKAWEKYKEESNVGQSDQKVISGFSEIDACEVVVYNNRKYLRRKKKAS
ncbi:MAG: hypothetical protein ACJ75J_12620 [Cytophagaceae bacterium]